MNFIVLLGRRVALLVLCLSISCFWRDKYTALGFLRYSSSVPFSHFYQNFSFLCQCYFYLQFGFYSQQFLFNAELCVWRELWDISFKSWGNPDYPRYCPINCNLQHKSQIELRLWCGNTKHYGLLTTSQASQKIPAQVSHCITLIPQGFLSVYVSLLKGKGWKDSGKVTMAWFMHLPESPST